MNKELAARLPEFAELQNHADIEAKGFIDVVQTTKDIWCLCSVVENPDYKSDDPECDEPEELVLLFHDYPEYDNKMVYDPHDGRMYQIPERVGSLVDGFRYWYTIGQSKNGEIWIHNGATYDKPVVEKVVPKCLIPDHKWQDTFIKSKIQWFERPQPKGAGIKSAHGLAAYGKIHGILKPPIEDWTTMDEYKLHRVVEDVRIQRMTSKYLQKEDWVLKNKVGVDMDEAYKMSFEYAKTCHRQEQHGAMANKLHMEQCVITWDKRLHKLEGIIEPKLPPTVSGSGTKIDRKEMAVLLGYPQKIIDKMTVPTRKMTRNGVESDVPVKPYFKPTTKWTTVKKANQYSGFNISYGFSPSFLKRKELTDWIKENHPDTKPKDWDIEKKQIETELLNHHTCNHFGLEPEDTQMFGGAFTKVKFTASTLSQHEVVKGYLIKSGVRHVEEWNIKKDKDGQIQKAEHDMVISYPKKAAKENQLRYKVKKGQPIVTSPKISEKEYKQLEDETGKQIGEYNTTIHRRRFISNPKDPDNKGLLASIRPDGRMPCGVNDFMTATGRSSHRIWVNAPGAGALYGEEIRKCITVPEGRKLVSSDMNSAQLSIAAYYANNEDYFKAVCFGNEFKVDEEGVEVPHPESGEPWYLGESGHCTNMQAFGLVDPSEVQRAIETQNQDLIHNIGLRRKKSKGATFGVIFGCSGKKLALMLGIDEEEGNKRKNLFLEKIGLDRPIAILEEMCGKHKRGRGGYIELPFGFFAHCSSPHARFNYLDQGTEAACQKWAEIYFDNKVRELGLDAQRILSYHDEFTVECAEDITAEVGRLMNEAYFESSVAMWEWHKKNSRWFGGADLPDFHIQLNAGYKVGNNYWDVH